MLRNGKRGKVELSNKERRIIAGLSDTVNSYISENSDKIGLAHVETVVLSKDCKTAKIYINFLMGKGDLKLFNKGEILKMFNKRFQTKSFPSITFYSFNDEYNI